MVKLIMYLLILMMLLSTVFGATMHGTIYDMNLNKVNGAIVEVNSSPKQRIASIDGTYSFSLPNGQYRIYANFKDRDNLQKAEENITITSDGDYVLDLFLFSDISAEEGLFNSTDISIPLPSYKEDYTPFYIALGLLLFLAAAFVTYRFFHKKTKEKASKENEAPLQERDLDKIVSILKKQGGRSTQKDIRKEIPLSEAKISLMIAELESEGKIKKIKKGRGNIIVLQ